MTTEDHLVDRIITVAFGNHRHIDILTVPITQEQAQPPEVGGIYKLLDVDYDVAKQTRMYIFQRVDG